MNVEMFFVQSTDRAAMVTVISERLEASADAPHKQPGWGLESSYDVLLANEPKRKVAVSPVQNGWIAAVESKEVLDFALLQEISERLNGDVVACQLSNVTDSCGYARCCSGQMLESEWLENVADPLATVRAYLKKRSIPYDVFTFREAVRFRGAGWEILQRKT